MKNRDLFRKWLITDNGNGGDLPSTPAGIAPVTTPNTMRKPIGIGPRPALPAALARAGATAPTATTQPRQTLPPASTAGETADRSNTLRPLKKLVLDLTPNLLIARAENRFEKPGPFSIHPGTPENIPNPVEKALCRISNVSENGSASYARVPADDQDTAQQPCIPQPYHIPKP